MLLGAIELVRSRGRLWRRDAVLLIVSPLVVLATPYGPLTTARYYWTLLVDPPFGHEVTEWMWAKPAGNTVVFYVLAAIALPLAIWGRRRIGIFGVAVLALTFAGALEAVRGIPWFALACMLLLPVGIGSALESRRSGPPLRRLNTILTLGAAAAVAVLVVVSLARPSSWYESEWKPGPVGAVRHALRPSERVFAPDVYSDWLLWKIPELRGHMAYDVRFEIYSKEFFQRLLRYNGESGTDWKSLAAGYPIVVVDEGELSHTADFLAEPGARRIFRSKEVTIVARPATS
jgi:hypothetical protein